MCHGYRTDAPWCASFLLQAGEMPPAEGDMAQQSDAGGGGDDEGPSKLPPGVLAPHETLAAGKGTSQILVHNLLPEKRSIFPRFCLHTKVHVFSLV